MSPFLIRPWDRPRPRLHPPLPDSVREFGGKTYELRERHGLTFVRERGRGDEWLLAFDSTYNGDFEDEMKRGRMARAVLLPFQSETWRREFPLFFRPDGTGWLRESWNREDIEFAHDLSLHEWLEAPASSIYPFACELFRLEIAPQLENLNWPKGRDLALEFAGGTKRELETVVRQALALEEEVRGSGKLIRATFQSESPFFRAGVFAVQAERGEVDLWFDEGASPSPQSFPASGRGGSGERVRLPWKRPGLRLSNRFWSLCDFAVDTITPLGHYFDSNDEGAGRLSESPQPRGFSLQFIADKLPSPDESRVWLGEWLRGIGGDASVLDDDLIADFEAKNQD
jgi:hypothetical protein